MAARVEVVHLAESPQKKLSSGPKLLGMTYKQAYILCSRLSAKSAHVKICQYDPICICHIAVSAHDTFDPMQSRSMIGDSMTTPAVKHHHLQGRANWHFSWDLPPFEILNVMRKQTNNDGRLNSEVKGFLTSFVRVKCDTSFEEE